MNIYLLSTHVSKWRGASELGERPAGFQAKGARR
jgi:hypothetical protein